MLNVERTRDSSSCLDNADGWTEQREQYGSGHVFTTDEEAEFTALVRRQSRFVFRVAYAVLLNAHDAEDTVQEIFLKLYRNGRWRDARAEQAFLARVAWRAAVDRRRAAKPAEPIAEPSSALHPVSHQPGPEQALLGANQHALIYAMIDALPEDPRLQ